MSKKQNKKFITPEILRGAVKGAFVKLNPRYMMRNPVMFVVEIGCSPSSPACSGTWTQAPCGSTTSSYA